MQLKWLLVTCLLQSIIDVILSYKYNFEALTRSGVCNKYNSISRYHATTNMMIMRSDFSFLLDKSNDVYNRNIIRLSIDSCRKCLSNSERIIEIEFPPDRKSDLSVTETLDTTRELTFEILKSFATFGKQLIVLFPDRKELLIAKKRWGEETSFFMASLDQYPRDGQFQLAFVITPGFNVEEWIDIPAVYESLNCPMVIVNGNLDRLRNGYYPRIFYPGLYKVSQSFYSQATQALYLSPRSVGGSRLGAWSARVYPNDWQILVKSQSGFDVVHESTKELDAKSTWEIAKQEYAKRWRESF